MRDWEKIHGQIQQMVREKVIWGASYGFVKDGGGFPILHRRAGRERWSMGGEGSGAGKCSTTSPP